MDYDYYEDRPRIPEEEHRRRLRAQNQLRRQVRLTHDGFINSRDEFYRLYRMSQEHMVEIIEILRPYVRETRGARAVSVEKKVLCAVGLMAQGNYQRPHGRNMDFLISQPSVSIGFNDVLRAFNHPDILNRFIHFPSTRNERDLIIQRNAWQGMPGVLGYIDGTLVKIVTPGGPDKHIYRSRKGYPALNVQIVCDSGLMILNVNAQFPGSANDPWIYRMSAVRVAMMNAFHESPCWLLGDSAYPHEPWLQLPLPHALRGTPEYHYTKLHCRNRSAVERCIGVLKGRWRCLLSDRTLQYAPRKAALVVNACAVLHNFLRQRNAPDPNPINDDVQGEEELEDIENDLILLQRADEVRAHLIQHANERHHRLHGGD